jgi:hypothetical protein
MSTSKASSEYSDTIWIIELAAAYTVVNIFMTAAGEVR